jgi:acetyltransferase-like isoleucine patch superfamily enzyme
MLDLSGVHSVSGRPVSSQWVVIGDHSYYARTLLVGSWLASEKVVIGKYCSIGDMVTIITGGNRRTDVAATYPMFIFAQSPRLPAKRNIPAGLKQAPARTLARLCESLPLFFAGPSYRTTRDTTIGNDVWVGYGATISGGARVCDGAVVASGSVVFSDVPPYAIVAGNPARVLRHRFSPAIVTSLLRIGWWDWPDERVREHVQWFYKPIGEFVDRFDPGGGGPGGRSDCAA